MKSLITCVNEMRIEAEFHKLYVTIFFQQQIAVLQIIMVMMSKHIKVRG